MAKKATPVSKRYVNKEGDVLLVADTFVYEVEIFKSQPNVYNLEDSKTISSASFTKNEDVYFQKEGIRYHKYVTLMAAPLKWLENNKYIELCQDQGKKPKSD